MTRSSSGTILLWNDDWSMAGPERELGDGWRLTRDRRAAPLADAIVFHLPTLDSATLPVGRRPGQRWVAWSMESDVNYPRQADPAYMASFDLTMTYRRDSDVWVTYAPDAEALLAPPSSKTEAAPAVYVASNANDRSGRHAYVGEMMRRMAIDSYGRCHRNRTIERDDGRPAKLATLARYRFTLAFENSIARDYVTEKFFEAFVAGSVPVYLGAPNVADFAPGDHSFVDVTSFAGPRELAEYLTGLANDPVAYEAFHAWRAEGVRPEYQAMLDAVATAPICRLLSLLGS